MGDGAMGNGDGRQCSGCVTPVKFRASEGARRPAYESLTHSGRFGRVSPIAHCPLTSRI
jgi:hypothetical protein